MQIRKFVGFSILSMLLLLSGLACSSDDVSEGGKSADDVDIPTLLDKAAAKH